MTRTVCFKQKSNICIAKFGDWGLIGTRVKLVVDSVILGITNHDLPTHYAKCCMDGKRIRCLQIVSQHVLIYLQQFPSYSNRKCKKSPFSPTTAHISVFPGDAPATMMQNVASMVRQFNACQTSRSIYLSIFNSFRVILCLNQCVGPKIAISTTFLFPLGTPLAQSR